MRAFDERVLLQHATQRSCCVALQIQSNCDGAIKVPWPIYSPRCRLITIKSVICLVYACAVRLAGWLAGSSERSIFLCVIIKQPEWVNKNRTTYDGRRASIASYYDCVRACVSNKYNRFSYACVSESVCGVCTRHATSVYVIHVYKPNNRLPASAGGQHINHS